MKRFSFLGVITLLVFVFWAAFAQSAEDIRVGYIVPLSGNAARDGETVVNGAKLAISEINKAGGVLGRNIKLFAEDDKAVPAEGVNAAVKLVERDKVHMVGKDVVSSVAFAVGEAIRKMQSPVPVMTGVCTSPRLTKVGNEWFFRSGQNATMEAPAFVRHWVQNLKVKRVSFMAGNDDWGKGVVDACVEVLKGMGGESVSQTYFLLTDNDFYPILTKVKGERPDALMVVARQEQAAKISMQFVELGMNKMMKQLGSGGHATEEYIKLVGKEIAEGVQMIGNYDAIIPGPKNEQFVKAFKAANAGRVPDEYARSGYDNIHIFAEAVKRAGGTDPNKLREALEKTDYQGVVSHISFDKNRQAHPDLYILYFKDGVRQVLTKISTKDIDFAN